MFSNKRIGDLTIQKLRAKIPAIETANVMSILGQIIVFVLTLDNNKGASSTM